MRAKYGSIKRLSRILCGKTLKTLQNLRGYVIICIVLLELSFNTKTFYSIRELSFMLELFSDNT